MIKVRRYGKTILVNFENGKWTHVKTHTDASKAVNPSDFSLTKSFVSFFRKHFPNIKTLQLN